MGIHGMTWEHAIEQIDADATELPCGSSHAPWPWPDQDAHE